MIPAGKFLQGSKASTQGRTRTDTGLTPMVFETIASTNSATWALKHK